jgi:replicative DNA helicase
VTTPDLRLLEIEREVLGSAIRHPDAAAQWPLTRADFSDKAHGLIWDAVKQAARSGEVDPLQVGYGLDEAHPGQGLMGTVGEIARNYFATPVSGANGARILREKGIERETVRLVEQFKHKQIEQHELVAGLKRLATQQEIPAYTAAHGLRDLIDLLENPPPAIPTGIGRLDDQFSGLHEGDLVVIQARPAIGKTAIAITLARNMVKRGFPCLFYTGEMPAPQIMGRLVSMEAGVPAYKFRSGKLKPHEWDKFSEAATKLQDKPLYIADAAVPKLDDIVSTTHRMHEQKGIKVLFVDYAQRISTRKQEAFRHEMILIAKTLKGLARELSICVVLLAQSGRNVDNSTPKDWGQMPQMGDIQESAAYEQEADMVMGLARNGERAMLGVLKNRAGPTGLVPLHFNEPTMEFTDYQAETPIRLKAS